MRYGSASGSPVPAGGFVHIPPGTDVVVDESTVDLSGLLVEGRLVFQDYYGGPYELNAAYILVTGSLQVGCRDLAGTIEPYTKHATIRLIAPERYESLNPPGLDATWRVYWDDVAVPALAPFTGTEVQAAVFDRGLVVTGGGTLYLYGKDKGASWTRLNATVAAAASEIQVEDALAAGWVSGNQIVLASTDFEYDTPNSPVLGDYREYRQGEVRSIDVWTAADVIRVTQPLEHSHYGAVVAGPPPYDDPQLYPEWTVEEKGEVGLLTRNVVVEGEESDSSRDARAPYDGRHFGHVMLLPFGGQTPVCEVQWVEFRELGVEGVRAAIRSTGISLATPMTGWSPCLT